MLGDRIMKNHSSIVGGLVGRGARVPVALGEATPLDHGASVRAEWSSEGRVSLLLLLPPGTALVRPDGSREVAAALIAPRARFHLVTGGLRTGTLAFEPAAVRASASELGARRCSLCHRPLHPSAQACRCAGCGRVLCEQLCSTLGACPRCRESLDPWEVQP